MDMSKFSKKELLHCPKCNEEFPAQGRERYVRIVDAVRNNQPEVAYIFSGLRIGAYDDIKETLSDMPKTERDAILQPGGILTDRQIKLLS